MTQLVHQSSRAGPNLPLQTWQMGFCVCCPPSLEFLIFHPTSIKWETTMGCAVGKVSAAFINSIAEWPFEWPRLHQWSPLASYPCWVGGQLDRILWRSTEAQPPERSKKLHKGILFVSKCMSGASPVQSWEFSEFLIKSLIVQIKATVQMPCHLGYGKNL